MFCSPIDKSSSCCGSFTTATVNYFAEPIYFAIEIIKSTNQYVESCSFPSKLVLRFAFGAALGVCLIPLKIQVFRLVSFTVNQIIGKQQYHQLEIQNPMYPNLKFDEYDLFYTSVIGPIVEELIFRWALYYTIKIPTKFIVSYFYPEETAKKISEVTTIIFTSIAFGLVHVGNSTSFLVSLPQVIKCIVAGIQYGYQKEYGGGITMTIGSHIANNSYSTLIYMWAISNLKK